MNIDNTIEFTVINSDKQDIILEKMIQINNNLEKLILNLNIITNQINTLDKKITKIELNNINNEYYETNEINNNLLQPQPENFSRFWFKQTTNFET